MNAIRNYITLNYLAFTLIGIITSIYLNYVLKQFYYSGLMNVMDYGLENQVFYNTSRFDWFKSSYEVKNYLGDHFSLIILLFIPIYRLLDSGIAPLVIQTFGFGVGLWGIYHLACLKFFNKYIGLVLVGLCALYYPAVSFLTFHYHPIVLSFPFIIWGYVLLFYSKKEWVGALLLVIAATGKEDVGLTIAFIFLAKYLESKKLKYLGLSGLMLIYTLVVVRLAIPYFRGGVSQDSLDLYGYILRDPIRLFDLNQFTSFNSFTKGLLYEALFHVNKLKYLLQIIIPFAGLSLLNKRVWVLLPSVAINYLVNPNYPQVQIYHHYNVVVSALMMCLMVEGVYNLRNTRLFGQMNFNCYLVIITTILLLCNMYWIYNPVLGSRFMQIINLPALAKIDQSKYYDLKRIQSGINEESVVVFDNETGGYFERYPNSACFDDECGMAEGLRIDMKDADYLMFSVSMAEKKSVYLGFINNNSERFELKEKSAYFYLFKAKK